ncbi:MAG: DUF177 domain-containing protein [Bacteroides sp.]|nr:DUF177 domain-containing protein [Lachnospiraceae bacterium]MCM1332441.1 DUF177 domain-containing protein [Bacteroides sp.]MCM1389590.1 DUF177 domain-containing protein [Bacteroides sp.]
MGKFSAYKLPLKSLPSGSHEFEYELGKQFFEDMESADIRDARLKVIATVNVKGDVFELTLKVSGEITLLCDRCLDEMQWPVDTEYHVFVKYGEDYNDDSDNLLVIPESDNFLNIAYILYDTVALTVPIKHVHPMGKCNRAMSTLLRKHRSPASSIEGEDGEMVEELMESIDDIDPVEDAPSDPRWDELKKLKNKDNEQ